MQFILVFLESLFKEKGKQILKYINLFEKYFPKVNGERRIFIGYIVFKFLN